MNANKKVASKQRFKCRPDKISVVCIEFIYSSVVLRLSSGNYNVWTAQFFFCLLRIMELKPLLWLLPVNVRSILITFS